MACRSNGGDKDLRICIRTYVDNWNGDQLLRGCNSASICGSPVDYCGCSKLREVTGVLCGHLVAENSLRRLQEYINVLLLVCILGLAVYCCFCGCGAGVVGSQAAMQICVFIQQHRLLRVIVAQRGILRSISRVRPVCSSTTG